MFGTYTVIFKGKPNSGKSSLFDRLRKEAFLKLRAPTIGVDVGHIQDIRVFDTSGEARFNAITKHYVKSSQMVIYCIDLSDDELYLEPHSISDRINAELNETDLGSVILVGTKFDLALARLEDIHKNLAFVAQHVKTEKNRVDVFITSSKDNTNILNPDGLLACISQISKKEQIAAIRKDFKMFSQVLQMSSRTRNYYKKVFFKPHEPKKYVDFNRDYILENISNLLQDYASTSILNLLFHPNRHHRKKVMDIVNNIKNKRITSVDDVLLALNEIEKMPTFNHQGSLARRIAYILENEAVTLEASILK